MSEETPHSWVKKVDSGDIVKSPREHRKKFGTLKTEGRKTIDNSINEEVFNVYSYFSCFKVF